MKKENKVKVLQNIASLKKWVTSAALQKKINFLIQNPPWDFVTARLWFQGVNTLTFLISDEKSALELKIQREGWAKHQKEWSVFQEKVSSFVDDKKAKLFQIYLSSFLRGAMHDDMISSSVQKRWAEHLSLLSRECQSDEVGEKKCVKDFQSDYQKKRVFFQGRDVSFPFLTSLLSHHDEAQRRESYFAFSEGQQQEAVFFQNAFENLKKLRQTKTERLGKQSFFEVNQLTLEKTTQDLLPMVERDYFENILPFLLENKKDPWNINAAFHEGAAFQFSSKQSLMSCFEKTLLKIHPMCADLFQKMKKQKNLDLYSRPDKASGAFCVSFHQRKQTFLFANLGNKLKDLMTLAHEFGHALHAHASFPIDNALTRQGEIALCEWAAFTFEHAVSQHLCESDFPPGVLKNFQAHRQWSLFALMGLSLQMTEWERQNYDHKQFEDSEKKNELWASLNTKYRPFLNWKQDPHAALGWMSQPHIFHSPFYFFDYACALQRSFQWRRALESDWRSHWAAFLYQLSLGGRASFGEKNTQDALL